MADEKIKSDTLIIKKEKFKKDGDTVDYYSITLNYKGMGLRLAVKQESKDLFNYFAGLENLEDKGILSYDLSKKN